MADLKYNLELPVTAYRADILAALRSHPVVIVSGDTGSGKTTQLPKMALEAGCAARGRRIAVTQPRRLAAVTMANRVADELGETVGQSVGYQHRFGKCLSPQTRVTFMTDGILLAETRGDPLLRRYDAIIIDEAHERSLNIDFLLGIVKRILARRTDLKVIVSSATLDTERFAAFFDNAPTVNVPGRLFPIDVVYRPPPDREERDLPREIAEAVQCLPARDDILVFLAGERDIRETAAELEGRFGSTNDVIPLIASLPAAEQRRAFQPSRRRRIILATNVAETSVTIPGIRAVIDSGLARLSRYIHRTQIQRLQIEPVSQASARQRMGRCGRLGPGTCIRLYSEEDLLSRDAFTPPEVLRSSLAGVILTMLDLRLGDISDFPFLDPPRPSMIHEGFRELLELGAVTRDTTREPALTPCGRALARMPLEPRLGRMLLAAAENAILPSVLPLVAALSCDDPKRRPIDERAQADQAHAAFRVPGSDFLGTLRLWRWWLEQTESLSQAKARALAKKNYLSYPKMREWRDLVRQLTDLTGQLRFYPHEKPARDEADFAARLHRSLLAGLLGRLGRYDEEERNYRGAHGLRFEIHPGSVLAKKIKPKAKDGTKTKEKNLPPPWIMAGELVETTALFARDAAVIDPAWLEPIAGDLCRRSYNTPVWDAERGFARITEQVTLYGLVIVPARRRDLFHLDPALARRIFLTDGLLAGALPHPPPEVRTTLHVLAELRDLSEKLRRPEIFPADRLYEHFDTLLPDDVASADGLRRWLRAAPADARRRFVLKIAEWRPHDLSVAGFPDHIVLAGKSFPLSYAHEPDDSETDGVTCTLRRAEVPRLRDWQDEWLVPGLLGEKIAWMLNVLPSALRRVLAPIDERVAVLKSKIGPGRETLAQAISRVAAEEWGFRIPPTSWDTHAIPNHLRMRFVVRDDRTGAVLLATRDKNLLFKTFTQPENAALQNPLRLSPPVPPSATWSFGTLPETVERTEGGWRVMRYPALRDEKTGVVRREYDDRATAERIHARGVTRLLALALAHDVRLNVRTRDLTSAARDYLTEIGSDADELADGIFEAAVRTTLVDGRDPVRDDAAFLTRASETDAVRAAQNDLRGRALSALAEGARLLRDAETDTRIAHETADDIGTQIVWLFPRGFPAHVPADALRHYPRYLKAIARRLERAAVQPAGDRSKMALFRPHWERYREALRTPASKRPSFETLEAYRWLLEEYRVSVFAQELKTSVPVSPKRLDALWTRA